MIRDPSVGAWEYVCEILLSRTYLRATATTVAIETATLSVVEFEPPLDESEPAGQIVPPFLLRTIYVNPTAVSPLFAMPPLVVGNST